MINMKTVLVYDINTLPEKVTIDDVLKKYNEDGILLFDSTKGANPYVININSGTPLNINPTK